MAGAKRDGEEWARADSGEDAPDWTTWLRSRLERVSSSEDVAAESDQGAPEQVGGGDEESDDDLGQERALTPDFDTDPGRVVGQPQSPAPEPPAPEPPAPEPPAPEPVAPVPVPDPPASEPVPPAPERVAPMPVPDGDFVVEIEALRSSVTGLSARVDAMSDTFSRFRTVMNERLDGYTETVLRVAKGSAAEVEEYRRAQSTSTAELGRAVTEVSDRLQRMAGGMEELVAIRGDDERWAEVMGRLLDEVDAERQASEREALTTADVVERLDGLEQALKRLAADMVELAAQRSSAEVVPSPLSLDDAQVRMLGLAVADAAAESLPSATGRPPARPRKRRVAPLQAERKAPPGPLS